MLGQDFAKSFGSVQIVLIILKRNLKIFFSYSEEKKKTYFYY